MNLRLLSAVTVSLLLGLCTIAAADPVKVFVLVGQSNMQGHARIRTFAHIAMDPKTAPLLDAIQNEDGTPRVCDDVWISSLSTGGEKVGKLTAGFGADEDKIGPELTFGIYMQEMLGEPIVIIKTAWGGKSLHTDFRPPSAGPFEFSEQQLARFKQQGKDIEAIKADKVKATGHYYRQTVEHVKKVLADLKRVYPDYDSDQGYALSGLVWFQGWNDMVDQGVYPQRSEPGGYDNYSTLLGDFIRDIRKDLNAPQLPIVIGVMGVNGPTDKYLPSQKRNAVIHQNFRSAMAAPALLPEFKDNVKVVFTENYWDMELVPLRTREAAVKRRVKALQKEGKLDRKATQAVQEELLAKEFTEQELATLKNGISNAEYHYLGSAKIMTQIGKGFAEALAK